MKENTNNNFSASVRRAAVAIVAFGIAVAPSVYARPKSEKMTGNHSDKVILVRPTDLPELARQDGEAMLLHETGDGRTFLYIEQNRGARLAIFDVTDPQQVKEQALVQIEAPGSFDFVTPLGDHAELVRFQDGRGVAVLGLHKVKLPTMNMVQSFELQALEERLGKDGLILTKQANMLSAQDYQVVETPNPQALNAIFEVKGVRQEITNDNTGTTFLLTSDGLYLIRRPAVEQDYETHQFQLSHSG